MKTLKVLIIEDDLITANAVLETLVQSGHSVTNIARNLDAAISSIRNNPPDLALVDISLSNSKEDGIEIAERIIDYGISPIIYLTGNSEKATVARARHTQPAAYLLKPIRHKELAIQIELAYHNYQIASSKSVDPLLSDTLYLPVEQGKGYVKIHKSEVLYIKADRSYVEIYSLNENKRQDFSMHLGYISQFFGKPDFYQLSRSLLVNLKFVEKIEKDCFYVKGIEQPVYFPESSHKKFLQQFAVVKTPPKRTN